MEVIENWANRGRRKRRHERGNRKSTTKGVTEGSRIYLMFSVTGFTVSKNHTQGSWGLLLVLRGCAQLCWGPRGAGSRLRLLQAEHEHQPSECLPNPKAELLIQTYPSQVLSYKLIRSSLFLQKEIQAS